MHIAPLEFPGQLIVECDAETARDCVALLRMMSQGVTDAALALAWFDGARSQEDPKAQWQRSNALLDEAFTRVMAMEPDASRAPGLDVWRMTLAVAAERNATPAGYLRRVAFLHARTFLFSLDAIGQALRCLVKVTGVPSGVADALALWEGAFPTVKPIRDSIHHMEERILGRRHGKSIALEATENEIVSVPAGSVARVNELLIGNRLVTMTESGNVEELVIDMGGLTRAQSVVQASIDAFSWEGPGDIEPRA